LERSESGRERLRAALWGADAERTGGGFAGREQLMKRDLILVEEREAAAAEADAAYAFLQTLREKLEQSLLNDAGDSKKVALGDYLKLVALLEERRKAEEPEIGEVVVRWEDPVIETNGEESFI
jgi:hypothetical protein